MAEWTMQMTELMLFCLGIFCFFKYIPCLYKLWIRSVIKAWHL